MSDNRRVLWICYNVTFIIFQYRFRLFATIACFTIDDTSGGCASEVARLLLALEIATHGT